MTQKKFFHGIVIFIVVIVIVNILVFAEVYVYLRVKINENIKIPFGTEQIFTSDESEKILFAKKGKITVYSKEKTKKYKMTLDISQLRFNDDMALIIDKDRCLYSYSFNDSTLSDALLSDVSFCDMENGSYTAVTDNGELYLWGDNQYHQLGFDEGYIAAPKKVEQFKNCISAEIDGDNTMVLTAEGEVYQSGVVCRNDVNERICVGHFDKIEKLNNIATIYSRAAHIAIDKSGNVTYWTALRNTDTEHAIVDEENKKISELFTAQGIDEVYGGGSYYACKDANGNLYICGFDVTVNNYRGGVFNREHIPSVRIISYPEIVYSSDKDYAVYACSNAIYIKEGSKLIKLYKEST